VAKFKSLEKEFGVLDVTEAKKLKDTTWKLAEAGGKEEGRC
jgi:hypothetical protein